MNLVGGPEHLATVRIRNSLPGLLLKLDLKSGEAVARPMSWQLQSIPVPQSRALYRLHSHLCRGLTLSKSSCQAKCMAEGDGHALHVLGI